MQKQQFNGIQTKLLTVFILLTLVIVGSFVVFSKQILQQKFSQIETQNNQYLDSIFQQTFQAHIQNIALSIARKIIFPLESNKLNRLISNHEEYIQSVYILNTEGIIINTNSVAYPLYTKLNNQITNQALKTNTLVIQNVENIFFVSIPLLQSGEKKGILILAFSKAQAHFELERAQHNIHNMLKQANKTILENTLSTSMIAVLVAFLISILTVRSITNPIRSLLTSIRKIASGDLTHVIKIQTNDELQQLAESFESMTKQLKKTTFSKEYVECILSAMANLLIVLDAGGRIKSVNEATLKLLGYEKKEIIGMSVNTIFHARDLEKIDSSRAVPQLREVINKGVTKNQDEIFYTKHNEKIPILFSATAIRDSNGILTDIVCVAQDITVQKMAEQKLADLAHFDILTKLPNRLDFDARLNAVLAHAKRHDRQFALLFIDLDNFKNINDAFSHGTGDLLLQKISQNLMEILRAEDYIARLGGDEFAVILPEIATSHDAGITASKIIENLNRSYQISEKEIALSASIGIAIYPSAANNAKDLAKNADIAMYSAKRSGRNNYQYFTSELDKIHARKLMLENSLRSALKHENFHLVYQPKFDLLTHQITSIETLIRWEIEKGRFITPEEFIPIAEKIGLIIPIGKWVLNTACCQFAHWKKVLEFPSHFTMAINVSPIQLEQPDFASEVIEILKKYHLSFQVLELEVTETALMNKPEQSEKILNTLNDLGIHITIDDFGTGYSSLIYLKKLPISALKIDKSFTKDMIMNSEDATLVQTIIAMASSLKMETIAEGVENKEQIAFLKENHCTTAQGFYFSKPLLPDDMLALFKKKFNKIIN